MRLAGGEGEERRLAEQLLALPSLAPALWPALLPHLVFPHNWSALPALAAALANLAPDKETVVWAELDPEFTPHKLLARLLVSAGDPVRAAPVLLFLQLFASQINRHLGELWVGRAPLLAALLGDGARLDPEQWRPLLLALLTDSLAAVGTEEWTVRLVNEFQQQVNINKYLSVDSPDGRDTVSNPSRWILNCFEVL